ncbi:DUF3999 family protein [Aquirhabdus sp.]|uniref:DUF3999 family protein n=1 Tax=Aquirhabdus sp. TaxID=2824160 RepID=UPI00396C48C4
MNKMNMAGSAFQSQSAARKRIYIACCLLASSFVDAETAPIHVRIPIQIVNATPSSNSGIQKVDLPLNVIALLNRHSNHDDRNYQVLDANRHVMPIRIKTPMEPAQEEVVTLRAYHWPAQAPMTSNDAARLEFQLSDGQTQATVTLPSNSPSNAQLKQLEQAGHGKDQKWLLAMPVQANQTIDKTSDVRKITLLWPKSALSMDATLEGSDDLVSWSQVATASLLETAEPAADDRQLKQSSIQVSEQYRYWRLSLSAPLALTGANLTIVVPEKNVIQTQNVVFQPNNQQSSPQQTSAQIGEWLLDIPIPVAASAVKFSIPENQVWSLSLSALLPVQKSDRHAVDKWQLLTQQSLHHWKNPPVGQEAVKDTLWLVDQSATDLDQSLLKAVSWKLQGTGPRTAPLPATIYGPTQALYFLAQGQAPYHLEINSPSDNNLLDSDLPVDLPEAQAAQLGAIQIIPQTIPWRRYGLWGVLVIIVTGLGFAAWRLIRGLDRQTD